MKKITRTLAGAMTLALVFSGPPLFAQEAKTESGKSEKDWKSMKKEAKRAEIDAMAGAALDRLLKENPKAKELYNRAYGWAAFDNLKIGAGISGGGGKGVAVSKESKKRTYMSMGSGGVGATLGAQTYQVVFLFGDSRTYKKFIGSGWEATAAASAAAGKGSGSQTDFVNGLAIFQIDAKGLMASADISGTKYSVDKELN